MIDNTNVVINSDEEAKEVVQKRADAYEHTVKKASSLLQLIIGGLSVITALAAAGLLTEFTSIIFNPDGVNELTVNEAVLNILSFLALLTIVVWGLLGMITHLISILLNRDYPGVIPSQNSISHQSIVEASNKERSKHDSNDIRYSTWLIHYACGKTESKSPLSKVQHDYRVAVYAGVSSTILLFLSVILLSYLFEGVRGGLLLVNISIILLAIIAVISYFNTNEDVPLKQDISKLSIVLVIILLAISALLSGGAAYFSSIELYQQFV
jgi:hypothetical protein